jgi:replicative DNA helicase
MNTRQIEQAILKRCLYSPEHLARVVRLGNVFNLPEHQELFNIMARLYSEQRHVDQFLIDEVILSSGSHHLGVSYIGEMAAPVKTDAFDSYLNKVMEKYIIRTLESEFTKNRDQNPKELLAHLTEKLMNLESNATDLDNKQYCRNQVGEIENPPTEQFVRTGIDFFDDTCGGFANKDLIIIAARPGGGKTHKMINILEYVTRKIPAGVFSMEEPGDMIFKKMACSQAGIDTIRMRQALLTAPEKGYLAQFLDNLYNRKIIIDDESDLYAEDMMTRALRMKNNYGIKALFVDYLQFAESRVSDIERIKIKAITKTLKQIAKELDIPVVALAQADRNLDNENATPQMKDLYGGSYIEKTADVVIFLQPSQYDTQATKRHEYNLNCTVAKHKNGPVGSYIKHWKKNHAKISNF